MSPGLKEPIVFETACSTYSANAIVGEGVGAK